MEFLLKKSYMYRKHVTHIKKNRCINPTEKSILFSSYILCLYFEITQIYLPINLRRKRIKKRNEMLFAGFRIIRCLIVLSLDSFYTIVFILTLTRILMNKSIVFSEKVEETEELFKFTMSNL